MQALAMAPFTTSAAGLGGIVGLAAVEDITAGASDAGDASSEPDGRHHLRDAVLPAGQLQSAGAAMSPPGHGTVKQLESDKPKPRCRVVSFAELEQHRTAEDAWLVVDGNVYDITPFLENHPGGDDVILEHLQRKEVGDLMRGRESGRKPGLFGRLSFESSAAPNAELHSHSKAAFRMLQQFFVGELQSDSESDTNLWKDTRAHIVEICDRSIHLHQDCVVFTTDPGRLHPEEAGGNSSNGRAVEREEVEVDLSRPIVCQVGRLGDRYNSWVHDPVISKEIPRFFESDFLEFFTQTKWWAVPLVWIPAIVALVGYGLHHGLPSKAALPSVLLGLFIWTLLEYFLHRFLFHMQTTSYWGNTFHYVIHGFHHKHPMDGSRLVFPPLFAFVIASIFWFVILLVRIPRGVGAAGLGGALLGYVCYDLTHYFLHFGAAFNETSRKMKRYHLNHHFKVQSQGFGVMTWTMWDRVFGTLPAADKEETSFKTTKAL